MAKIETDAAIDAAVGRRIRTLRIARGISQSEIAKALGVTFQQVQKYEKGTNRISVSRLQQTAELFGVPAAVFFNEPDAPAIDDGGLAHFVSTREGYALNSAFAGISDPEVRRKVIRLVKAIVKNAEEAQAADR